MMDDIAFSAGQKAPKLYPNWAQNRSPMEDNGSTWLDSTNFGLKSRMGYSEGVLKFS